MDMETAVRKLGGVWPSDDPAGIYLHYLTHNIYIANTADDNGRHVCTRTEFDECARRLRNEPSFDDAPDWVKAKAQDSDGCWWFYSAVPSEGSIMFNSNEQVVLACKGEVIGDWRDTIKIRPEEKEVEEDNVWHERGEFPPDGTVCEVRYYGHWKRAEIVGWDDGVPVVTTEWDEIHKYLALHVEPSMFRPIQTERERVIEKALGMTRDTNSVTEAVCILRDAGMLKMPEDK